MPKRKRFAPHLKLNKYGIYTIHSYEDGALVRRSTRTDDPAEAQQALADYMAGKVPSRQLPIREITKRYMSGHGASRTNAPERQVAALEWIDKLLGHLTLLQVNDKVIEQYCQKRRAMLTRFGKPPSDGTLRRELNTLIAAINYCRKQRVVSIDDVPAIQLPPPPPPKELWLTELESDQLLSVAVNDQHPDSWRLTRGARFVVLALATAARKSAVMTLSWEQVDMDKWVIHYQKGATERPGRQASKKRRVAVPVAAWARPYLQRMHDERVDSPWVLDHTSCIQSQFERIIKIAAVRYKNAKFLKVTPHTLRHTAATLMLRAGTPLWEVAGVLGDTPATVAKVYGHHCPEQLSAAVNSWKKVPTEVGEEA